MKVLPIHNTQINNQIQSPAFGRFKVPENAEGGKVLKIIQKFFPTMGSERIGSSFLFRTQKDMVVEAEHYKLLATQELQKRYDGFLNRNAPVLRLNDVENLSEQELEILVTTTEAKFQAFVSTFNLFNPKSRHIKLPVGSSGSNK